MPNKLIVAGIKKAFANMSPHMRELGFEILDVGDGFTVARVRYAPELVGDPRTGVLAGGVVTSLLDSAGGAAVLAKIRKPITLATLDLRIDYMRPSSPGLDVMGRVECFKTTRSVAFTRGVAYDRDPDDPVASMAATYMLNTQSIRKPKLG